MTTKEIVNSYKKNPALAHDLEKKIATLRASVDALNPLISKTTDTDTWIKLIRERNNYNVDIELCKRKLYNLRIGNNANGEPEFGDMGNGTATRKPFID